MGRERISFSVKRNLVEKGEPSLSLFFSEEVLLNLEQFANLKSKGEHGGFLIGTIRRRSNLQHYESFVERFVPIPQRKDVSRLVINRDHIRTVDRALKSRSRKEVIVGWIHTHPGFGIFLSDFDQNQHRRYFPEPWQIALVIDNFNGEKAAYYMVDNELKNIDSYSILHKREKEEEFEDDGNFGVRLVFAIASLVLLISLASLGHGWVQNKFFKSTSEVIVDYSYYEPATEYGETEVEYVYEVQEQANHVSEIEQQPSDDSLYAEYVVKEGDNLWSIAKELLGDANMAPLLIEVNNLENPRIIREGIILKIPLQVAK